MTKPNANTRASTSTTDNNQIVSNLKLKRRTFKAQITNFTKYIESYQDSDKERVKLRDRVERLRSQFSVLNDIQDDLARLDDFEQAEAEREEITDQFDDIIATAVVLLNSFEVSANRVEPSTSIDNVSRASPAPSTSTYGLSIKLPKIDLPKFDGRMEKWVTFKGAFTTMIHAQSALSNIQKLNYLRLSLSGKAEAAIEAYTISDENYERAWNHLIEIYDNKRALILRHAALLRDTPTMPDDTSESIFDLANYMQLHVRSLQALGRTWENIANDLLTSIVVARMGNETRKTWERTLTDTEMPNVTEIFKFLFITSHQCQNYEPESTAIRSHQRPQAETQCRSESNASNSSRMKAIKRSYSPSAPRAKRQAFVTHYINKCRICDNNSHAAYQCNKFLDMTVDKRIEAARKAQLCLNCLRADHEIENCKSGRCRVCNKPHNTKNHQKINLSTDGPTNGLMATAIVNVFNRNQQPIECRTLVDTCANANFITEDLAAKLRLPKKKLSVAIEALNAINTVTNQIVATTIESRSSNYKRNLTFFTIPRISGLLPDTQIDRAKLQIPANIQLADPHFHRPAPVDMLIGSGPSLASLSVGQINLSPRNAPDLILQKTQFGWIIGGSVPSTAPRATRNIFLTKLNFDLKSFWEIEEGPHRRHLSSEEQICEDHFSNHVRREISGRYIVALPFNEKISLLGESHSRAVDRFSSLERKLNRDPDLRREYSAVIEEYLSLGHMTQVRTDNSHGFYLPHHAVIKPSSTTTKVRVVFDGSAKSSSGLSLNETLITGPTIQDDIFSLLLRFRMYTYVLTGDIEKMYRQFLVRPEDRRYQRILWRNERNEIATYELNTVTFGLSSAPFQAVRCLHQLADDEATDHPRAATALKRDMYVDDLLTGANTFNEARLLRNEIINILQRGGLNIRQWASNEPELLTGLTEQQIHPKFFGDTTTVKTLGIFWNAREDKINYTVDFRITERVTKRTILSAIARIFDPLGLLGPITITAKIIMQQLWQLQLDWDESLPIKLHTEWTTFVNDLTHLNNFSFRRNVTQHTSRTLELHGFCDASERAYGACLYVRSVNKTGQIRTDLLCAKSRVAPLKTTTLARLELCAAALLATLYRTIQEAMTEKIKTATFWTDSTIVLNWLNKEPNSLKTFIANRVADIQTKTNVSTWRHVRSHDNPADLLSRGQPPAQFIQNQNWSHGPEWLSSNESVWPVSKFNFIEEVPETKRISCFAITVNSHEILNRYSNLSRLRKIVAYSLRFRLSNHFKGSLTIEELQAANDRIIQLVQSSTFAQDIHQLKNGFQLHYKSKLLPLHPFVDDRGLLRVGGRLQNSTLSYEKRHPILLPRGHHITDLIIRQAHVENHHAGITTTLYAIRQTYWLIDGRNATRKIIRQCVRCFRVKPPTTDYVMGHLPAARVTENRPFSNCGIDYCGPFYIKERRFRNRTRIKVYVAVFICFATKAAHLEVVSDMTTEAFLAALKRFIARRGLCRHIYSDNGSNFMGANNELTELHEVLQRDKKVQQFLTEREVSWHFMPALSPHFGGLWEAAVKSFKHHVKRVVGEQLFTFEQFNTFVIEVEAILNSRPLTPLSSDPNDPLALTPGHFLIGDSLMSLPEIDFSQTPNNRLSNWQHIQKVKQDFWIRWHKEYINHLNIRHKWTKGSHNITEGTIVVLKEDHLPPLQWRLGRIETVHPGKDKVIRAVTVRTTNGVYKRNVKQLAPLPIQEV